MSKQGRERMKSIEDWKMIISDCEKKSRSFCSVFWQFTCKKL